MYLELFRTLSETVIDPTLGVAMLQQIKQRKQALILSEESFKFSNGNGSIGSVISAYDKLDGIEEPTENIDGANTDLDNLLSSTILDSGLRWRLDCLNKGLGSLRSGDFGFLFKRPESGGTAFCASEVSYMLDQAKGPVIWINNEESDDKVIIRVYQGYFGVTRAQLIANSKKYKEEFQAKVGDKFKFFGADFSNKLAIESIVKKFNPSLMIYDQLDNVKGFAADRNDLVLGEIYKWARTLTKQGHAAIGITQADGTAEGQKWLTMQHVSEAKTTKQATADFIIGMGAIHEEAFRSIRYLNLCKNKLSGDKDSIPRLRHGKFETFIEPEIMRFRDIINYS